MRYQYLDARLKQAFDTAGLERHQRSVLQGVLRALDPDGHLGEHVAGLNSAFLAVSRARVALECHAAEDQPRWNLLRRVIGNSVACMDAAAPGYDHGGAEHLAAARKVLLDVDAQIAEDGQKVTPTTTRAAAERLDPAVLDQAVRGWLVPLWTGVPLPLSARMIGELAVSVAVHGRDGMALRADLLRLLRTGPPTVEQLTALFWPEPRRYVVALLVKGARVLKHLDRLLSGARQEPLHRNRLPKDEFLREHVDGSSVLVRQPVEAPDAHTAVLRGRRALSEVLDQYAAGERLTDLVIAPVWQVSGPTGRVTRGAEPFHRVWTAYPLTPYWPNELRSAMRVANLARQVDAPMASAGLAWSALEATGLDPSRTAWLAKAIALQVLRQQLISLHVIVTNQDKEIRADLDAQVPTTGVTHHLTSVDSWVEVLLSHTKPKLKAAREAVTALGEKGGGLVQDLVELWRYRLSHSDELAAWLTGQETTAAANLDWLYVSRNLAFHAGKFAVPGDVLTAHAGQALADLTLEFLGNWRTIERNRGDAETSALEIYRRLAQRQDQLVARLKRAGSCRRLSVEDISGPDEKWWSRGL